MNDNLKDLLHQVSIQFEPHAQQIHQHMWSLVCWNNGYYSIEITDNWHNWLSKNIELPRLLYPTPEKACMAFLKFIKKNKIDCKSLQEVK